MDHQGVNPSPKDLWGWVPVLNAGGEQVWTLNEDGIIFLIALYSAFNHPSLEIRVLSAVGAIQLPCSPRNDKSQWSPSTQVEKKHLGMAA